MAEPESDTARPPREEASRPTRGRSRRLGRRLALAGVVAPLAYLIVVGLASVVPQVFWPPRGDVDPSISCADGLRSLRGELLSRAGERVAAGGGTDGEALRRWLRRWDLSHRALEARCTGPERRAWRLLGQLRQRLQGTLERFDAEEGELARALDHSLARPGR